MKGNETNAGCRRVHITRLTIRTITNSADKGKTWSEEIMIYDDENRVCTDIAVGLDRDTKKLWLFFLKDKKQYAHLTSTDNGLSWQGPVVIHEQVIKPQWETLKGKDEAEDAPKGNPKSHAVQWEKDWVQRYGCGPGNAVVQLKSGSWKWEAGSGARALARDPRDSDPKRKWADTGPLPTSYCPFPI